MDYKLIIDKLVKEGKITRDDVDEASNSIVDPELAELVELYHMHCCLDCGNEDCGWMAELENPDPWTCELHNRWLQVIIVKLRSGISMSMSTHRWALSRAYGVYAEVWKSDISPEAMLLMSNYLKEITEAQKNRNLSGPPEEANGSQE